MADYTEFAEVMKILDGMSPEDKMSPGEMARLRAEFFRNSTAYDTERHHEANRRYEALDDRSQEGQTPLDEKEAIEALLGQVDGLKKAHDKQLYSDAKEPRLKAMQTHLDRLQGKGINPGEDTTPMDADQVTQAMARMKKFAQQLQDEERQFRERMK